MTPDDPSLLTAYLDGELDPAASRALEASMAGQPIVAGQLRELAVVRDLLNDLSRPTAPAGVSGPVLSRITAHPPIWLRRRRAWRNLGGGRGVGLGVGVGLALSVGIWLLLPRAPAVAPRAKAVSAVARPPLDPPATAPPRALPVVVPAPALPEVLAPTGPPPTPYISPPATLVDAARAESARQVKRLLQRPSPRFVSLAVDALDPPTMDRVAVAVRSTGLRSPEYGLIRLDQGGRRSIAMALTVDAREADRLIRALRVEFAPSAVSDPGPLSDELAARLEGATSPEYLLPERSPAAASPSTKASGTTKAGRPGTLVLWLQVGSLRP